MTCVSIHQPGYIPWLGYFEKIARSDIHVFLDDVQFEKNSFDNRNKIRTREGPIWLTVPVMTKGRFGSNRLMDVEIDNHSGWNKKHWKGLETNYAKAPFFRNHAPFFEAVYAKEWRLLKDLNMEITVYLLQALGIRTRTVFSSQTERKGKKSDLVLDLCKNLGATTYLSGILGKDYLALDKFQQANIRVLFQEYEHPVYHQQFPGFVPNMSVLDLLFNEGPRSLEILLGKFKMEEKIA